MLAAAARILLAAVLAWAAVAKLRRPPDFASLLPAAIARPVARVLPFVEFGLAVALVVLWSSPLPAIVAGLVVLAFTVVLVRAELRQLPCPCFGAWESARAVSWVDLVRNGVLLACAVLATAT